MKNWKCIIGATILTPICLAALAVVFWCLGYILVLMDVWILIIPIALAVALAVLSWYILYDHCKEYWAKRKTP